ncbi:hypothetical protein [Halobacillus litoralis]|uniref:hypothetical protein n=1 Tax=Halobacillus litoralis TaxID=45668 RepID=UPI000FFC26A3|nr:hypothetical protein [Halobacillus litoralis]
MNEPMFDGYKDVTDEEVVEKMKYFMSKAKKGMDIHEYDKKGSLEVAKELREELKTEYKNNDLVRISKAYQEYELFSPYSKAVHEAYVSVTGAMSYKKHFHFLYDVYSYMLSYLPTNDGE